MVITIYNNYYYCILIYISIYFYYIKDHAQSSSGSIQPVDNPAYSTHFIGEKNKGPLPPVPPSMENIYENPDSFPSKMS